MERVKGIEPSSVAWEATALPLSYTRSAGRQCRRRAMKSAIRRRAGMTASGRHYLLRMTASGRHYLLRMTASGRHYLQNAPLKLAKIEVSIAFFCIVVALRPMLLCRPNSSMRAPRMAVA